MKQPLPESYLNLLAGAETLAAWQPSVNVLEDISNWNCPRNKSQTACQLKGSANRPGAAVAGERVFSAAPNAALHRSGWTRGCKPQQPAAPNNHNQQPTWPRSQRQQAVEQQQERHISHSASLQQDGQPAAMQQPLLPCHTHQQQQLQQFSNHLPPSKRSREQSLAALDDSDWRSVKRSSCSPLEHEPSTRQLQREQQPTAFPTTTRPQDSHQLLPSMGATDPGGTAGRAAAAASPALMSSGAVNDVADDVELCLPDSQPEAEQQVAIHPAAAAAQAPVVPAAVGRNTACAAGWIPYIDYIPATEMDVPAATAAAGLVLFREYVPATEFPTEDPHPAQTTNGPVHLDHGSFVSTARLAAGAPDVAVDGISTTDVLSTTATPKPCTTPHEALTTAAVLQKQGSSGLVLYENFVPATVLSEIQPEQLVTADAAVPGQLCEMQQLAATTAAVGAHQTAGQSVPSAVAGGGGSGVGASQDRALGGCYLLCSCSSPTDPCSSSTTSSSLISSDEQDRNIQHQQEQQLCCDVGPQQMAHKTVCWQDIGETQPQPHAITRTRHLSPHHQPQRVLLGSSGQQQLQPQHQSAASPAVPDAGETQPQPRLVLQQWQQQLVEGREPAGRLQQAAHSDPKELQPLPALAGQQRQQQQQQLVEGRELAATQQEAAYLDLGENQPLPAVFQQQQKPQLLDGRQLTANQQLEGYLDVGETQPQPVAMTQRQLHTHQPEDLQQQHDQQRQQQLNVLQQQQQQQQQAGVHLSALLKSRRECIQHLMADQQQQQQKSAGIDPADVCPSTTQGPADIPMPGPEGPSAPAAATVMGAAHHTSATAGAGSSESSKAQLGLALQAVAAISSKQMMIPSGGTECVTNEAPSFGQSLPGTHSRKAAGASAAAGAAVTVAATSGGALVNRPPVGRASGRVSVDIAGGMRVLAGGWHLPARHRKWNTAPKPGSIMSFWNKAGVLDSK